MTERPSNHWTIFLFACALASVTPLWCAKYLPFCDLPEQLTVIASFRHWGDPQWSGGYELAVGRSQYVLYHLVAAVLAVPLGAETANLVVLSTVGIATPFALRCLLRALGRDERLALFAVPVFWSRPLVMGFLPYVASMPLVAYGLALAVRQWESPRRGRSCALAALPIALFFLHVDPFVVFLVVLGAMRLVLVARDVSARGVTIVEATKRAARDLAWLAPALAIGVAWGLYGSMRASVDRDQVSFLSLPMLLREFPSWSFDVWRSHVDEGCAIVVWLAFSVLVLQRAAHATDRWKLALAAAPVTAAIACYFALPYHVGAASMLNVRIAVFVVLFAPLLVERIDGLRGVVPLAAVAVAGFVLSVDAIKEVRDSEAEEIGDMDRVLAHIRPGAKVVTLPFHLTSPRSHFGVWYLFGSYHRVRRGGVAGFSFAEIDHWPIHFRADAAPPSKPLFWTLDACTFRNATDGAYYDYVLTRGNVDPFRDDPPGPQWRKIDAEREWTLYERIPGAENPAWTIPDPGPCESRRSLETSLRD